MLLVLKSDNFLDTSGRRRGLAATSAAIGDKAAVEYAGVILSNQSLVL